jgi:uncharacterized protein YoxC
LTDTYQILLSISIIIQIILFIAFIILIFKLTDYLKKLIGKTEELKDDISNFKIRLEPLIDDTLELVKKLNTISGKVEENIDTVKKVTDKIKDLTDDIYDFKNRLQKKIEPPINDTINFYNAIIRGVKVFTDKLKAPRESKMSTSDNLLFDDKIDYDVEIKEEYNDINKELNEVRKKLEEMKKV